MSSAMFFMQSTHQSHARRLYRYAAEARCHFYPPGMCEEAVELGPHTDREGPCLVQFKNSKLTPEQLNAWLAGSISAGAAVVRVYWMGDNPSLASSKEDLLQRLLEAGPAPGGAPLRLQCSPRSLEGWLGDALPASFNLQPVDPSFVLNVVQLPPAGSPAEGQAQQAAAPAAAAPEQQAAGARYMYSLQPAASFYNYSSAKAKRVPDQLCKAAGKLAEALQAANLELTSGVAVDIGAAPGGWTHVLATRARQVVAVDPAALDPRALASGAVTHLACKAEDAVPRIRELVGEAGIDLLVSDVNRHPSTMLELLRPLLPLLRPGGTLIMTLKFFGLVAGREEEWRQKMAADLGPGFERVKLLWLLANTRHEQTCIAFKSATSATEDGVANGAHA